MVQLKKIPKWAKVTAIVLLSCIAFVSVAIMGVRVYFMTPVDYYYAASETAFKIPGLNDNFVPQGLYYDEEREQFLVSGYFSDKTASAVYLVDKTSGKAKQIRLGYESGMPMKGHAGGVAFYKDWVYVAGSSSRCVLVYSYTEMLNCKDGGVVDALGRFSLEYPNNYSDYINPNNDSDYITSSFLTVYSDNIVIGEFHYGEEYALLDSHEFTTTAGDKHGGVAIEFKLSDSADFGIKPTPVKAYSIPDKVQGMTVYDDEIYLATSYGLNTSVLYKYDYGKVAGEGSITLMGEKVSFHAIDSSCLIKAYDLPPMAEGIIFVDGKLYTMSEFACNKYILGKFTSAKWCYATDLKKM